MEETRKYESLLLKAIFNEAAAAAKNMAIYGQTVFIKPGLDGQKKLRYSLRNFTGMVLGTALMKSKKAALQRASQRVGKAPLLTGESSAAYYLWVNVQSAIDGFNGTSENNPNYLEKYSAAWFAHMTSLMRNSEQWNKDILAARKILQEHMARNQNAKRENTILNGATLWGNTVLTVWRVARY